MGKASRVGKLLLGVIALGMGWAESGCRSCSKSSQEQAATDLVAELVPADADPMAIRRAHLGALKRPPVPAPADALPLGHGGHWRLVKEGDGEAPGPGDVLHAELSIWKSDGALAFSTYQSGGDVIVLPSRVPEEVLTILTQTKPGAVTHLWLPRELVAGADRQGRRPMNLPVDDVVIEYELVSFDKAPAVPSVDVGARPGAAGGVSLVGTSPGGADFASFPPADAAGPPPSAATIGSGGKYVVLRPGTGAKVASADSRVKIRLRLWQVRGLLVEGPVIDNVIATTPRRAPALLARVVAGAKQGQALRLWLSPEGVAEALPSVPARESICDLVIQSVGE